MGRECKSGDQRYDRSVSPHSKAGASRADVELAKRHDITGKGWDSEVARHLSNARKRALRARRLDAMRRKYSFEPRRMDLGGEAYETIPLPAPGDGVTTTMPGIELQFIYRPSFLLSIDADYKMRQIQPRIAIREGWRFVY